MSSMFAKFVRLLALWCAIAALSCGRHGPSVDTRDAQALSVGASFAPDGRISVKSFGAKGDGVTDDSAAIQAGVNAVAGTGTHLILVPGTYLTHTTILVPSNTTIEGTPGTTIVGNLTSGAGSTRATFLAQWTGNGVNTTVHASNVVGTNTISSNGNYAVGQQINIAQAAHIYQELFYQVTATTGTGPYTLTLDRPVVIQYQNGDTIGGLGTSIPKNVHLIGHGMKMTGTPVRHVEFAGCWQCSIEGIVADASQGGAGDYWFSFDVGGYQNTFRDMFLDMGSTPGATESGIVFESGEDEHAYNCHVKHAYAYGFLSLDTYNGSWEGCSATNGTGYGISLNGEDGAVGTNNSKIVDGDFSGNGIMGVAFFSGAKNNSIADTSANYNGSVGIELDGSGTESGNRFTNISLVGNTTYGFFHIGPEIVVDGALVQNNGTAGFALEGDAVISDVVATPTSGSPLTIYGVTSSANISVDGLRVVDSTTAGGNAIVDASPGTTINLRGFNIAVGTNDYGVFNNGGKIALTNGRVAANGSATGTTAFFLNAGPTIQLGSSVDGSGCASLTGGGAPAISFVPEGFASAKGFGAKGDGATDDSTAIQYAVNALSGTGSTLLFTAGSGAYVINTAPTVPLGARMDLGVGATFKGNGAAAFIQSAGLASYGRTAIWNGVAWQIVRTTGTTQANTFQPTQLSSAALDLIPSFGITPNGGPISAWLDRAGLITDAGAGTSLTQGTGGNQPTVNASCTPTGQPCAVFNGTTQFLQGPAAVTPAGTWTVLLALQFTSASAFELPFDVGGSSDGYAIGTLSGNRIVLPVTGSTVNVGTATTAWEIWSASWNGSTLIFRVNGIQTYSGSMNSPSGPTPTLTIGKYVGGDPFGGNLAYAGAYGRTLAPWEVQAWENSIAQTTGIAYRPQVIFDGNSLTFGSGTVNANNSSSYAARVAAMLGSGWDTTNNGVSGETTPNMDTYSLTHTDPYSAATRQKNIVLGWEGTNDIATGGSNAATAYANIVTYCQHRRSAGFKVAVGTILPRNSAGFDAIRDPVNTNIRANWTTFADALVDFAADARIGPDGGWSNAAYYVADGIHLNDRGAGIAASIAYQALQGM